MGRNSLAGHLSVFRDSTWSFYGREEPNSPMGPASKMEPLPSCPFCRPNLSSASVSAVTRLPFKVMSEKAQSEPDSGTAGRRGGNLCKSGTAEDDLSRSHLRCGDNGIDTASYICLLTRAERLPGNKERCRDGRWQHQTPPTHPY